MIIMKDQEDNNKVLVSNVLKRKGLTVKV